MPTIQAVIARRVNYSRNKRAGGSLAGTAFSAPPLPVRPLPPPPRQEADGQLGRPKAGRAFAATGPEAARTRDHTPADRTHTQQGPATLHGALARR